MSARPSDAAPDEARLRERFATREEPFTHGAFELHILLPLSPEALIDEEEFEADERLPYWAELWPSAKALARHLLDAPPPESRTLELGCGVALPSLALHARGCTVLATDYYDDALRFARINATRNGLPPLPVALLDWRALPAELGRFDTLLAADVLYEQRNVGVLAEALRGLAAPGGRVLLADPGRVYLTEFRARMEELGWSGREVEVREETSDPATGAVSRVRLFELRAPTE